MISIRGGNPWMARQSPKDLDRKAFWQANRQTGQSTAASCCHFREQQQMRNGGWGSTGSCPVPARRHSTVTATCCCCSCCCRLARHAPCWWQLPAAGNRQQLAVAVQLGQSVSDQGVDRTCPYVGV